MADQPVAEVQLASLGRRFAALFIDWVLCLLIARLFLPLTGDAWRPLVPSLVLIAEYAFFLGLFGQTPGMRVTRIRCAPMRDGDVHGGGLGVPRAALRGLLLALVVPGLVMDGQRRGWHDRAAGSVMLAT